jgi:long-chain fatty acid transport protein
MPKSINTAFVFAIAGLMANQMTHAAGFSLYTEGSAAEIGNFAAGAAAEGIDASIGWYNPAGLVLIHDQQAVFSGVGVLPSSKLTGTSTFSTPPFPSYTQSYSNLQGGKNAVVPAFHYARPLGSRATFGLSLTSPFGLSTNWGETSPVRYAATLTELMTVNISPELGGLLTDHLAIGAGLDLQWAQVKFNSMVGAPPLASLQSFPPNYYDSLSNNKGTDFDVGFHAGLLGMYNDNHTRLGLNYQSGVNHQFNGTSVFTGRLADPELTNPDATFINNHLTSNDVQLPNMVTLSGYQDVNTKLALLGSAIYTGWSSFRTIKLNQVAAFSDTTFEPALIDVIAPENYKDTWRFAVGANYHFNEQWMLRTGAGYDETPTVNASRDVRLPDANRWALAIGGHYQMRPNVGFDLGYAYLWANGTTPINNTQPLGANSTYNVNAKANVYAQLIGLQVVWAMDKNDKT